MPNVVSEEQWREAEEAHRCCGFNSAEVARRYGGSEKKWRNRLFRGRQLYNDGKPLYQKPQEKFIHREPSFPPDYEPDPAQKPTIRVRMARDMLDDWCVVAIGDYHASSEISNDRAEWIGRYAREKLQGESRKTAIIQIGDFATFDAGSRHDRNDTLAGRYKPSWKEDLECLADALARLDRGLDGFSPDEKHVTLGNHDCPYYGRPAKWTNENPESRGWLEHEIDRAFASHAWTYSPMGHHYMLGGVGFVHCPLNILGREIGGEIPSNQITNKATYDIVYGHTHKADMHRRPKLGHHNYVVALNLGCSLPTGRYEDYVNHGAMAGWWWGVKTVNISDGHIQSWDAKTMKELQEKYG